VENYWNIKPSTAYYYELNEHEPRFNDESSKLSDERKQAKLQRLQKKPSQTKRAETF